MTIEDKALTSIEKEIQQRFKTLSGATTARLRELRCEFSKRLAAADPVSVVDLASRLRHTDVPEFVAFELVQHHKPAMRSLNNASLERLGRGINSWVAVDTFASYLSGPAWREQQVSDAVIKKWARSSDRWWRRAALVSTVPLNNKARGGSGDTRRTLMICEMLTKDRDDMVVKALSWALRELSKHDIDAVRQFLVQHAKDLAPRVLREVNNKLSTGVKNPRLKP